MPLIISIPILIVIAFLYIVFRSRFKKTISNIYLNVFIEFILLGIGIPICLYFVTDYFNRDDRLRQEEFRKNVTASIINDELKTEELEKIITEQYQDIFDSSDKEAQTWAEDFIKSLPTKQKDYQLLSNKSEDLANVLKSKWNPIVIFTLKQFDRRISELNKQGLSITLNTSESDEFFLVENLTSEEFVPPFRSAVFPNGNSITVTMRSAVISKGILTQEPFLRVQNNTRNTREGAFKISFQKNLISLAILSKFLNINSLTTNDISIDDEFFESIREAIEESITFVLLDDMENVNVGN